MEGKRIFKKATIITTLVFAVVSVVCDVLLWFVLRFPDCIESSLAWDMLLFPWLFSVVWNFMQVLSAPILFLISFMGYPGKGGKLLLLAAQLVILLTWFLSLWNIGEFATRG